MPLSVIMAKLLEAMDIKKEIDMKIRNGFVSNSSSSSFICDVSGCVESGMNASLSDFEMSRCINGHTFYDQYRVGDQEADCEGMTDEEREAKADEWGNDWDHYDMPEKYCPICTMTHFKDDDLFAYMLAKHYSGNKLNLEKEVRNKFSTYKEFIKG